MSLSTREDDPPDYGMSSNLDDIFVDYLMSKNRESADIDFKLSVDISRDKFAELAKDIFAFSNNGGGFIVIGFREKETGGFERIGLAEGFHIDQADLQQKFNAYTDHPIVLGYREFGYEIEGCVIRFAAVSIPPSTRPLIPTKDGKKTSLNDKEKTVFKAGDVLVRRGTQSILASDEEKEFIKRRSEEDDCRISLLSGNPDSVREVLLSNLFEVEKAPTTVYSATLRDSYVSFQMSLLAPFITQGEILYSFLDPTDEPLKSFVRPGTTQKHKVEDWRSHTDDRNLLLWLLDATLIWHAGRHGMFVQRHGKKLYYPLRKEESERKESWPGLSRKSTRRVAAMMYAQQLGEEVGVHPSISVHFMLVGDRLCLRLTPTYVLTSNGRTPRRGEEEGTVITRLSHDDYNKTYLRNLLFWVDRLGGDGNKITVLDGRIVIGSNPISCDIESGIRSDRPTLDILKSGNDAPTTTATEEEE